MTRIAWSPQALKDLESIRTYIAQDSQQYADLVVRRIIAAVEHLENFPESGRVVPEWNSRELREVVLPPFRIVYRHRSDRVEIVAVFRSSQALRYMG